MHEQILCCMSPHLSSHQTIGMHVQKLTSLKIAAEYPFGGRRWLSCQQSQVGHRVKHRTHGGLYVYQLTWRFIGGHRHWPNVEIRQLSLVSVYAPSTTLTKAPRKRLNIAREARPKTIPYLQNVCQLSNPEYFCAAPSTREKSSSVATPMRILGKVSVTIVSPTGRSSLRSLSHMTFPFTSGHFAECCLQCSASVRRPRVQPS